MLIFMRIIVLSGLVTFFSSFFYQLNKSRFLQNKLKEAYGALDEASAERIRKAKRNAVIQQEGEKGFLEKLIEGPARNFTYSGLGRMFPGLTVEIWLLLIIGTSAILYFILMIFMKRFSISIIATGVYIAVICMFQKILIYRNYKSVDNHLLHFLNQLGNFSLVSGEITGVFHQISRYLPSPLSDVLEECYYDAQISGNTTAALYAMTDKIEHEKFKEIISNIEICTNYTSNFKIVVENCRKSLMDEQRAKRERKTLAQEAVLNMGILSILLIATLALSNELIEMSIWNVLFHTLIGQGALFVIGICYVVFIWKIFQAERG